MLRPCSFPDSDMYSVGRQDMSLFWGYGKQLLGSLRGLLLFILVTVIQVVGVYRNLLCGTTFCGFWIVLKEINFKNQQIKSKTDVTILYQ